MKSRIYIISFVALLLPGCAPEVGPDVITQSEDERTTVNVYWQSNISSIEVPIEIQDGMPVIHCQVNGNPSVLLVDTGCNSICLYQQSLKQLDVGLASEDPTSVINTASGPLETVNSQPFSIAIADGLSLSVLHAKVLPSGAEPTKCNAVGILGGEVLIGLSGILDLENRRLILKKPNQNMDPTVKTPVD